MLELLEQAPAFIEDYEPLDMQEKYWAAMATTRYGKLRGLVGALRERRFWVVLSLNPNDVLGIVAKCGATGPELLSFTISAALAESQRHPEGPVAGVAIADGYPNITRLIEAKPGER
jgi:hypothetical protein